MKTIGVVFSCARDADKLVWCNGMNFDLPILENAFQAVGARTPWSYYNGRDYRTLKGMFPKELVNRLRVKPTVAHDALDDARAQALALIALLAHHNGQERGEKAA